MSSNVSSADKPGASASIGCQAQLPGERLGLHVHCASSASWQHHTQGLVDTVPFSSLEAEGEVGKRAQAACL